MFSYIWPIALVVLSNVVYQICAKSTPRDIDPLASLTVTYAVGAIASAILYYATNKGGHLLREYSHLNWSPFVLGIVIVGLEVGFIAWPPSCRAHSSPSRFCSSDSFCTTRRLPPAKQQGS